MKIFVLENSYINTADSFCKNSLNFLRGDKNLSECFNTKHKLTSTVLVVGILLLCFEFKTTTIRNLINNCFARLKAVSCNESTCCKFNNFNINLLDVCQYFKEKIEPTLEKKKLFSILNFSKLIPEEKFTPYVQLPPNSSRNPRIQKIPSIEKIDISDLKSPERTSDLKKFVSPIKINTKLSTLRETLSKMNPSSYQNYIRNVKI